jgi:hypothetical protein
MIISVEELKKFINTNESDEVLQAKLQALELMVREYTNNGFHQIRLVRIKADVIDGVFVCDRIPFKVGYSVQVTMGDNAVDCGLYTVKEVSDDTFTVKEPVEDMWSVKVTKVQYKSDVKLGVVNMFKYDANKKVGVQSETLSRHTVTYFNQDSANQVMGYPVSLLGCLKAYRKARC